MNPVLQRRLESVAILAGCLALYQARDHSWGFFALLFFIPDLSILMYNFGPRIGGISYNLAHTFLWGIALGAIALLTANALVEQIALIWAAHAAFDRAIGWGLKYPDSFCNTDMGVKQLPIKSALLS
jgi:hypothetical protein